MNPFDEIAIEESLKLKEKKVATEVIAVTIGPSKSQETLRTALALGVDKAVHIETEDGTEVPPLQVFILICHFTVLILGCQTSHGIFRKS